MDLRCMRVRKELWGIFEDVFGIPYKETNIGGLRQFCYDGMNAGVHGELDKCMEFGRRVRRAGYTVVWMPDWEWREKGRRNARGMEQQAEYGRNGNDDEKSCGHNSSNTEL